MASCLPTGFPIQVASPPHLLILHQTATRAIILKSQSVTLPPVVPHGSRIQSKFLLPFLGWIPWLLQTPVLSLLETLTTPAALVGSSPWSQPPLCPSLHHLLTVTFKSQLTSPLGPSQCGLSGFLLIHFTHGLSLLFLF